MALIYQDISNAVTKPQQQSCLPVISNANSLIRMAKRRDLTDEEKTWAANLLRLWNSKKESEGLSQLAAAQELGYKTQSAFSQFLLGNVPLHTDAKAKMAKFLKVDVTDIDPNFYKQLGLSPTHLSPAIAEIAETLSALDTDDVDEILALVQAKMKRRTKDPNRQKSQGGETENKRLKRKTS